jgi:GDP-4-dehydro-6-deoxy-D-mannose reductase
VADLPLVTGATGFAGSHLVELLCKSEFEVLAWSNPRGASVHDRHPAIKWDAIDLLDREAIHKAISEAPPSIVYHCGGIADVGGSWADPVTPLRVNVLGTYHLLEAIERTGLRIPVVVAGSATVYRASLDVIGEDSAIGPASPYGISKLAQEMVSARVASFPVFLARPFNHAGPRQGPAFVTSTFARQIAEIEAGNSEPVLKVGNLEARRDIMDVRDTVRAYKMLGEHGRPGRPYNICAGRSYRIRDLLETLLSFARTPIEVTVDPARLRPADNPSMTGDCSRIAAEVGWRPSIPIEDTLRDLLDYWRFRVAVPRS